MSASISYTAVRAAEDIIVVNSNDNGHKQLSLIECSILAEHFL